MRRQTKIRVTLVEDSQAPEPTGPCSLVCEKSPSFEALQEHLAERFGDEVVVERLDLAATERPPEAIKNLAGQNYFLPLVLVNGQVRLSGPFDFRRVVDTIEALKEIEGGSAL